MFRRLAQVAPMAALMAIGIPPYSADAVEAPSLQSDDNIVVVRDGERWRGGWRHGGDDRWRFRGDDGWRGFREDGRDWRFRRDDGWRAFRGDDGWRFRGDDGWRAFREYGRDWRRFRRHRD
jgi:hypothetical protein